MELRDERDGHDLRRADGLRGVSWRQVNRRVRRLQARIAEAIRRGKPGKARALQRILTRSLCGCLLAVRRVTENSGGKTKGIDGEIWETPEAKEAGARSIQRGRYHAKALRRIYIPKKNHKKRPISIPTPVSYCTSIQVGLGLIGKGQQAWP